jgi:putative two-component system response regulator
MDYNCNGISNRLGDASMGRVLIADDERSIRTTLKLFLEREGYQVDTAENATMALQLVDEQVYDVILTDIIMPRRSGMELMQEIRSRMPDVPVIIMTGEPTVETAVRSVQAGAFDYVSKPVTKEILLKIVAQAMHISGLVEHKKRLETENMTYQKSLEEMVKSRTIELEKAMQGAIKVLVSLVDSRDPYTAGHQRRVGNLAASIAQEMGFSRSMVEGIRVSGYLHDIGKIAVPAEFLVKPSELTYFEFEIVKTHAEMGGIILEKMDLPWPVAEIVSQHHERIDGSGYPNGLKGEAFWTEGRILAVADVVEAMSSHRPYRPSLGLEAALKEIESQRGLAFDPAVTDACLRLFREKAYQIEDRFIDTQFLSDETPAILH